MLVFWMILGCVIYCCYVVFRVMGKMFYMRWGDYFEFGGMVLYGVGGWIVGGGEMLDSCKKFGD